jgi:dihydroorotate dehydrogenase
MSGIGNYHVLNISCPNAFGGQSFTDPDSFRMLMKEIEKIRVAAPLLIKLSPDLSHEQIDQILEISARYGVNGVICSNLTKDKHSSKIIDFPIPEKGAISGKPLQDKADELIKYVYHKTNGQMVIIGCGGVFSAKDAYKKIRLGASLIQLITGMIFEGPQLIGEINRGLADLLKRDGFKNVSEAVGIDNKN